MHDLQYFTNLVKLGHSGQIFLIGYNCSNSNLHLVILAEPPQRASEGHSCEENDQMLSELFG